MILQRTLIPGTNSYVVVMDSTEKATGYDVLRDHDHDANRWDFEGVTVQSYPLAFAIAATMLADAKRCIAESDR